MIPFALIMTIIGCSITVVKWKHRRSDGFGSNKNGGAFNVTSYNEDMLSLSQPFILGSFVIIVMLLRLVTLSIFDLADEKLNNFVKFLVQELLHPTSAMMFGPLTIIIPNPKLRQYLGKPRLLKLL